MSNKPDYYEILGVSRGANQNEIKSAYRRLARQHHPDVNSGAAESEAQFKLINEAYQVLCDPEKRELYDRYGHAGIDQAYDAGTGGFGDFGGFGDIFDLFFGGGQRARTAARPTAERGSDLRYDVEMTLEEAARGASRTIRFARSERCETCDGAGAQPGSHPETCPTCRGAGQVRQQQQTILGTQIRITTCPKCHGEGRVIRDPCPDCGGQGRTRTTVERTVDIPAGVDNGMRVRIPGEGDAGLRGGPGGDLHVFVHVRPHDVFERRGNDLWVEQPIGFALASLGGTVEVPTVDGAENLEVAAGTQPGEVYVLRGRGMPDPSGRGRGDLNVVLRVETPTGLNQEQKDLLRRFAESRGEDVKQTQGKSFFERVKDALNGL